MFIRPNDCFIYFLHYTLNNYKPKSDKFIFKCAHILVIHFLDNLFLTTHSATIDLFYKRTI